MKSIMKSVKLQNFVVNFVRWEYISLKILLIFVLHTEQKLTKLVSIVACNTKVYKYANSTELFHLGCIIISKGPGYCSTVQANY